MAPMGVQMFLFKLRQDTGQVAIPLRHVGVRCFEGFVNSQVQYQSSWKDNCIVGVKIYANILQQVPRS